MKTQVALRLDDELLERARKQAERENRSLANFVETLLGEALLSPAGSGVPMLSIAEGDLEGAVAIDDDGTIDLEETDRLHRLLDVADKGDAR
jgi:hypothetical protein